MIKSFGIIPNVELNKYTQVDIDNHQIVIKFGNYTDTIDFTITTDDLIKERLNRLISLHREEIIKEILKKED